MKVTSTKCMIEGCDKEATWACCYQFCGTMLFCSKHARQEDDWGAEASSYFFWYALDDNLDDKE